MMGFEKELLFFKQATICIICEKIDRIDRIERKILKGESLLSLTEFGYMLFFFFFCNARTFRLVGLELGVGKTSVCSMWVLACQCEKQLHEFFSYLNSF